MSDTLPLPEPDTHCFDDEAQKDVWSFSEKLVRETIQQAVEAEREACLNCYSPDDTASDWADKIRARSKA